MNERSRKLQHRQEEEQSAAAENVARSEAAPLEFGSAEELIRYDAAQTEVPVGVSARLQKMAAEASSTKPWWRRLLGQ